MTATTKPKFRVIENYSHEHKFEDFKKDYMNGMTKEKLLKKYDISNGVWREWCSRMPTKRFHTNTKKPRQKQIKHYGDYHHFRKNTYGHVGIVRRIDGHHYSYGTFPNKETAEMVCEKLLESGWDKYVAYNLLQEYGVKNSKKVLSKRLLRREI